MPWRFYAASSGNAFMFVLIAVAMFGALSFMVSRTLQSETTSTLSQRELSLTVSDILSYTQQLEQGISRLRLKGVSESDISFDVPGNNTYQHTAPQPDAHKLFMMEGGGVRPLPTPEGANNGAPWHFTGATCIPEVGRGAAGCSSDTEPNEELLAVLPDITLELCNAINARLGIDPMPSDGAAGYSTAVFTGAFVDGTETPAGTEGLDVGCFYGAGSVAGYHFYAVLLAR